nr:MAG TPA: hypothetical protein [Caudoviricetes sp.]
MTFRREAPFLSCLTEFPPSPYSAPLQAICRALFFCQ